MSVGSRRTRWIVILVAVAAVVAHSTPARAEGFISPFVGFNFGGDAGCPNITNCSDKKVNAGVAIGAMGGLFGFEEEVAYTANFFGSAPGLDSNVLTLMSNVMLIPRLGAVRPYVLAGAGLVKTHVSFTQASTLFTTDNNHFGWDAGFGLMGFFGSHVGARGDVRYFHSFQDLSALGFALGNTKLDFGRASVALVIKF